MMRLDIMILRMAPPSIATFSKMTLSIRTLNKHNITQNTTLSIATFSIMTQSIKHST